MIICYEKYPITQMTRACSTPRPDMLHTYCQHKVGDCHRGEWRL